VASKKDKAIKAANRFLQRGQVDKAILQYEKLVAGHERDPRLRHKLAELLARKNRVNEALEQFRWVAGYYEQGGFYPKAVAVYKQMLDLDPERMEVHLHLGEIYLSQGKTSDAGQHFSTVAAKVEKEGTLSEKITVYERLVRINPEDLDPLMRLIALYVEAGSPDKAIETLEGLADTMRASGDTDQLMSILDKLCSIADDVVPYMREMSEVHLDRGDARLAVGKLQTCFKADPQEEKTLTLLGRAFVDLDQKEKAQQVYEELSRIHGAAGDLERQDEVDAVLRELMADAGVTAGPAGKAPVEQATPLELPQQVPDEAFRHLVRGETYLKYGLEDRARDAVSTAVKRWPNVFGVQAMRARLLEDSGERETAAEVTVAMYGIAMDLGNLLVARRCLAETVRLVPADTSARDRLAAFDDAMGDQLRQAEAEAEAVGSAETSTPLGGEGVTSPGGHLRDEIDVEIDEVFRRPEHGITGSMDESMTGDDEFQALDENSLELLTYENYLSEVASGTKDISLDEVVDPSPDREIEIEDDGSEDVADPEDTFGELEDSEDFDALLSELATAIEGELREGDDLSLDEEEEETEDSEPRDVTTPGDSVTSMETNSFDLGRGYLDVGLFEEALREFGNAAATGHDQATCLLYMGRCERELGRWDEALERLQEGLQAAEGNAALLLDLQFELGVTCQEKGEGWMAYEAFGEVAQRDPSFRAEEVASRLEQIAAQLGVGE